MNEELKQAANAVFLLESQGVKFYENVCTKDEIFDQILAVRQSGLELLKPYADQADPQVFYALACEDLDACFIKALNYELELNAFYESFTDSLGDENFKDICFRLWATSNNEYIPALKAKLAQILSVQFQGASNAKEEQAQTAQNQSENILNAFDPSSFNQISQTLERISSGQGGKEDVVALLNNPNFSFFGGLALGGLTSIMLSKNLDKNKDKE